MNINALAQRLMQQLTLLRASLAGIWTGTDAGTKSLNYWAKHLIK